MQKIVTKDLKNTKRHLTGEEKIITQGLKILTLSFLGFSFGLFASNPVFAETMKNKVDIKPSMTLDIPVSSINLNLDPATKPFDSKDVNITVGTNNKTGYWISMSSSTGESDLVNIDDNTKIIPTIATAGSYTSLDFPINQWGYKIDSGNYTPFVSGATIKSSSTTANGETFKLNIASKIDYLQPSGTYNIALNIKMLPNMIQEYMQDITPEMCTEDPSIVMDKRDGQSYTIKRLAGTCWMIDNLKFIDTEMDSTTTNIESKYTPENPYITTYYDSDGVEGYSSDGHCTGNYQDLSGASMIYACMHKGQNAYSSGETVWYNYAAATAGTITGNAPNLTNAQYDICPAGWRLPTIDDSLNVMGIMNVELFNPVLGGFYAGGYSASTSTYGFWWTSTTDEKDTSTRSSHIGLYYDVERGEGRLRTLNGFFRQGSYYIRCILKES